MPLRKYLLHYRDFIQYSTVLYSMQYAKVLFMKDRRSGGRGRREVGIQLSIKGDVVRKPSSENLRPQIPGWSVWRVVSSHVPDGINCWGKTLEERQSLRDTKWSTWVISYHRFVSLVLHLSISKTCTHVETHTTPSGSAESVCYREIYAGILYGEIACLLRSSVNNFHSLKEPCCLQGDKLCHDDYIQDFSCRIGWFGFVLS